MGNQSKNQGRCRLVRWPASVVAWLLGVACGAVSAQDLASVALEQLLDLEVTGASKFSLRVSESPSSATVIGADEIRALGYRSLAEALQSVRGLVVSSDRTYAYLGVRGYAAAGDYNTRVLLLIDGNRVNDTVFDQAFLGSEFPLDVNLIERIEFIPGQGSAVHGGNALFGVVNVVTRTAASLAGSDATLAGGSGMLRQLRVSTSQRVGDTGRLLVSASKLRAAGSDVYYAALDTPANGGGVSHRTDHERGEQLYLKYEQAELSASMVHADRTKGTSATAGAVFGDPRNVYRDAMTLADATLARRIGETSLWKLRVYGGRYAFRGDYAVDYPPVTLNRDLAESRWWGLETNLFTQRFNDHKLLVGVDIQSSPRRDQSNADVDPPSQPYLDDRRSSQRQSVFAEDQWTLSPQISLTAGLRYDRIANETTSTQASPRLALVTRPADRWLFKLIHGRAFRAPNAYESFYAIDGTVGYKGNAALQNERVHGSEAVLEYRPSTAARWTASVYDNRADRLLVQTVDPEDNLLTFNNVGALRLRGFELEAQQVWPNGARLRGNYSLQRARDTSNQNLAERAAARLGKLAVMLPLAGDWTLGTQTVLTSRRGDVAGYGLTNLTLSRAWNAERSHLSISAYDVFDRQPDDPGSDSVLQPVVPQDGRSWRVELKLAF
jgi:outer membrane receptor protein involved in Fe transport